MQNADAPTQAMPAQGQLCMVITHRQPGEATRRSNLAKQPGKATRRSNQAKQPGEATRQSNQAKQPGEATRRSNPIAARKWPRTNPGQPKSWEIPNIVYYGCCDIKRLIFGLLNVML